MSFARQLAGKIREPLHPTAFVEARASGGYVATQHKDRNSDGAAVAGIMIAPEYLKRIAAWSRELNEREIEIARGHHREILSRQRIHFHARRPFRLLDRRGHRTCPDGHRVARRQG